MAHNSRCASAKGTACRCSCNSSLHGVSSYSSRERSRPAKRNRRKTSGVRSASHWQKSSVLQNPLTNGIIARALISGLTFANPPVGAAVGLAYTAYTYTEIAANLYNSYQEWNKSHSQVSKLEIVESTTGLSEIVTDGFVDVVSDYLVQQAGEQGLISDMADKTKIDKNVIEEMLKQSSAEAVSTGFSKLAVFSVQKVIGG